MVAETLTEAEWALREVADEADACQACPLFQQLEYVPGRKHLSVAGTGPSYAKVVVVGIAPGQDEADTGLPFVGMSGSVLDRLLPLAGLKREDIFILNTVKHRPPKNRDPHVKELKACRRFLVRQLQALKPEVVITLGSLPMKVFLPKGQLTREHGKGRVVEWEGLKFVLFPSYHPAAASYDAKYWALMVQDFGNYKQAVVEAELGGKAETMETHYYLATGKEVYLTMKTVLGGCEHVSTF